MVVDKSRWWNVVAVLTCVALASFWTVCFLFSDDPDKADQIIALPGWLFVTFGLVLGGMSVASRKDLSQAKVWGGIVLAAIIGFALLIPYLL